MHNSIIQKCPNHLILIDKSFFVVFVGCWVNERSAPGSSWLIAEAHAWLMAKGGRPCPGARGRGSKVGLAHLGNEPLAFSHEP